ncbi:MAG: VWA domain-containing protein, partial [Pedobacter sp.]
MKAKYALPLLLAVVAFTNAAIAQSSDQINYYILYDKSGSVPKIDKQKNLSKLLNSLIERSKVGEINSATRFTILPFGTENKLAANQVVFDPQNTSPSKTKALLNSITTMYDYAKTRKEKYSNIHAALEQLLTFIDTKRASGIFIFTDGILEQGDFDVSAELLKENGKLNEVKEYRKYLVDLIAKVKLLTGKPVFLIQTSNKPVNAYYAGLEEQAKKSLKDSVSLINSNT